MSLGEKIEQVGGSIITSVILAFGTGLLWVVRTVLTNQRQIALLESHLADRDRQRGEDREALSEVRDSVKRIETKLMRGAD